MFGKNRRKVKNSKSGRGAQREISGGREECCSGEEKRKKSKGNKNGQGKTKMRGVKRGGIKNKMKCEVKLTHLRRE